MGSTHGQASMSGIKQICVPLARKKHAMAILKVKLRCPRNERNGVSITEQKICISVMRLALRKEAEDPESLLCIFHFETEGLFYRLKLD